MPVSPAAARPLDLGVQLHVARNNVSPGEVERQLDQVARSNGRVVRVDVSWASAQPDGPGRWDARYLSRLDAIVDGARRRGVKVIFTFANTPCWASSAPASQTQGCNGAWWYRNVDSYLPNNPRDYAVAISGLAARYGTRLFAWELWNEPNQENFLRGPDKARRYVALVRAAYPAIKAAAPSQTVMAGVIAERDLAFAEALYAAGIKGYFDVFALHPYSHDASPLDPRSEDFRQVSFVRGVPDMRALMLRNGDASPMWLTEFGWSTNSLRGVAPWRNGVDLNTQARYVEQAIAQMATWDYVAGATYYALTDAPGPADNLLANYGLTYLDGRPKPALAAFARAAAPYAASATAAPVPAPAVTMAPAPSPTDGRMAQMAATRLTSVRGRGSRLTVRGRAPAGQRIVLEVLMVKRVRRGGRVQARLQPKLRRITKARASGTFAIRFSTRRLRRGSYQLRIRTPEATVAMRLLRVR